MSKLWELLSGTLHLVSLDIVRTAEGVKPTRRHVERGAASEIRGDVVGGGKTKVGKLTSHALVSDQDILWLQIPVEDADGMAVLNGVENLEKCALDHDVVANKLALLGDVGE